MAYGRGIYKELKCIFRFIWGKDWRENCCFEAAKELNTNFRGIRSQFSIIVPLEHIEQLNEQKAVQVENVGIIPAKIVSDVFIVIDGKKNNLQDRDFENVYNLTIHHSYFSK